jgi:predicted ATPase/DNA-binding SARP family transcriptional activator
MHSIQLYLFGAPRLARDGTPVELRLRKALALLAYLAVTRQPHSRDVLATLLWPDSSQREARGNLRRTLHTLKEVVGEVVTGTDALALNPQSEVWVDVVAFQEATSCLHAGVLTLDCLRQLEAAAALYVDHFLAGFTLSDSAAWEEWEFFEREGLQRQLARLLERLIEEHEAHSAWEVALPYARRWLALDTLHEPAHRALMRLYALSGQAAAALRQYEACKQILNEEVGAPPEDETTALFEAIRSHAYPPREPRESIPPARATPVYNLPAELTPLVGRKRSVADVLRRLGAPTCRLLTLVGPGGIGKTRLAIRVAEQARNAFADGVAFVSLQAIESGELIVPAVADALGLQLAGSEAPLTQLLTTLRRKTLLLVLDNFEQLLDEAERLSEWLAAAPELKVLVTSREPLHLREEWLHPVSGLPSPPPRHLRNLDSYDAVRLFVSLAQRVRPGFTLEEEAEGVARICALAEGMPLALELAATWARTLDATAIADEIEQGLDFLTTPARNVPERQRSIRAIFDATWQRLEARERKVFARLAIFRGGFTRAAGQAIAGASLPILSALVDKSVLQHDAASARYNIHELLRQYGRERLARDQEDENRTCERHAAFYCAALERWYSQLFGPHQQETMAAIEADLENARLAWHWAIEQPRPQWLAQAGYGLSYFFYWRKRYPEAVDAYAAAARALTAFVETTPDSHARIVALKVLIAVLAWQGMFDRLAGRAARSDRALQRAHALLDSPSLANVDTRRERALTLQQGPYRYRLDYDRQYEQLQDSLSLYRELDDPIGMASVLGTLGGLARVKGNYTAARQAWEENLAIARRLGDQRRIVTMRSMLNVLALNAGQLQEAEASAHEIMRLARESGELSASLTGLAQLGLTLYLLGRFEEACEAFTEQLALAEELGSSFELSRIYNDLSTASAALGRMPAARAYAQRSLEHGQYVEAGSVQGLIDLLLGTIDAAEGRTGAALHRLNQSVLVLRQSGWMAELSWALARLGSVAHVTGEAKIARQHACEALAIVARIGDYYSFGQVFPHIAFLLAEAGQTERAMELWTLAYQQPWVVRTRLLDRLRATMAAHAATLPVEVARAIEQRGAALDLRRTAETLLDEVRAEGWVE